jgi:hypothetical protein
MSQWLVIALPSLTPKLCNLDAMHERARVGCTLTDELISTTHSIGTQFANVAAYRECQEFEISDLVGHSARVVAILVGCG